MGDCIGDDVTECYCDECQRADDAFWREQSGDGDTWTCIGDDCLFPSPDHMRAECFTAEMMEAHEEETS